MLYHARKITRMSLFQSDDEEKHLVCKNRLTQKLIQEFKTKTEC